MLASAGIGGIIALVVGWVIAAAVTFLAVWFLLGNGYGMVAGLFNRMSERDKEKLDKKAISKATGIFVAILAALCIVFMLVLQFATSSTIVISTILIFCMLATADVVTALVYKDIKTMKKSKKSKKKRR